MEDWGAIIKLVGPTLISLLSNTASGLGSVNPPAAGGHLAAASPAIKDLQKFLNIALTLNPPLIEDGWLGPKTEEAIEAGIAKLRSAGIG